MSEMVKVWDGKAKRTVEMTRDEAGLPSKADTLATRRASAQLSRKEFALIAEAQGWITEEEAKLWVGGTAIPAWVEEIIDAKVLPGERLRVKLDVLEDDTVKRMGGLIPLLREAKGLSEEQLDALFGIQA